MRIEKPLEDYDIYIIYDFLDDVDYLNNLIDGSISTLWYGWDQDGNELINDIERSAIREVPPTRGIERGSTIPLEEKMKQALYDVYKDDDIKKYHFYPAPNVRTPDGGKRQGTMKQHIDGPHEDLGRDHGVKTYGAVYYLTDQFGGGELEYPKIGFKYKPVANSLILHPGKEPYWHGVAEIYDGWRICFGMLATEEYNLEDFTVYGKLEE